MRVLRFAAAGGCAALLAALSLSVNASASQSRSAQECGRVEFQSGLEAVFGHRKQWTQAVTLRNTVVSRGFVNATIVEACDFRVVVRGIDTFDIGVELQNEARREHFNVTLECIKGKEIGRIEAIFGHGRDRAAATAIMNRAESAGYQGLRLRNDPCGGFEVYLFGFRDRAEAEAFRAQAKDRGFNVAIERN